MISAIKKRRNQIRYNLHLAIRKKGVALDTKKRTMYLNGDNQIAEDRQVIRLRDEFDYAIQLSLHQN